MSTESGREKRWTPGPWAHIPWHVAEGDPEVRASKSHLICTTDTDQNARLIAAAPELVEALEANNEFLLEDRRCLLESITDANGNITDPADGDGLQEIDALLEKNRAALAKAYGEGS